ncbi:MAG: hypothetical protein R3E01_05895 [Pirellulaceae bacterium]|nr:hypothetical protein [Planctomycetales bacterium]
MSESIEIRLAKVERDLEDLKAKLPTNSTNWLADITGIFSGDPSFDEIVRLGKELRDAEQPDEE